MIIIVLSGSLVTCFVTLQSIWPFFAYSLYAFPEKNEKEYSSVEIIVNKKPFNFYNELPQDVAVCLESSMSNYIYLRKNNFTDIYYSKLTEERNISIPQFLDPIFKYHNLSDEKFSKWVKEYIELHSTHKVKSLKFNEIYISYNPKAEIVKRVNVF